jgi:hypothetical protein
LLLIKGNFKVLIDILQWRETVTTAREYLLGTSMELERRRVAQENDEFNRDGRTFNPGTIRIGRW